MNLKNQRRMAAEILKCGINRVWIDPTYAEDVADAITRNDVRGAISDGKIQAVNIMGTSRGRARYRQGQKRKGRRKGVGSRKGTKSARTPKKKRWMRTIRSIRKLLRELRETGQIDRRTYREYYRRAKGGMLKSRSHVLSHLKEGGKLKGAAEAAKPAVKFRKLKTGAKVATPVEKLKKPRTDVAKKAGEDEKVEKKEKIAEKEARK